MDEESIARAIYEELLTVGLCGFVSRHHTKDTHTRYWPGYAIKSLRYHIAFEEKQARAWNFRGTGTKLFEYADPKFPNNLYKHIEHMPKPS